MKTIRKDGIELTILMPCLNEAESLALCVKKAQRFLRTFGVRGEVLIADNGSSDGSTEIAARLGARVIQVGRRGYGAALGGGIQAARGEHIIMADADDSYDFFSIMPFLERLRAGSDLVVGNRFAGGIKPGAMPLLHKYLGNPVLSGIGRLFFHIPIRDFHCGLRGFGRAAILNLGLRTTGMEFASEMVIKAHLAGLRLSEVPTILDVDKRNRPPHLRSWRDGWRHLRFMLLFSPRWLFLYPGVLLMLLGSFLGAWLLPGPRNVGGVVLDLHALLYCGMAILVGFQAVQFAVFAKIYGMTSGLLPPDDKFETLFGFFKLETGLLAGALLCLGGLAGSLWAFFTWEGSGFGPLNPSAMLRIVVPSAVAVVLGSQSILASFFLSLLGLQKTT